MDFAERLSGDRDGAGRFRHFAMACRECSGNPPLPAALRGFSAEELERARQRVARETED